MTKKTLLTTYEEEDFRNLIFDCISKAVRQELAINSAPTDSKKQFLTRQETAELLSISLPTLHDYTKRDIIDAHRLGNKVRYKIEDIEKALININRGRASNGK